MDQSEIERLLNKATPAQFELGMMLSELISEIRKLVRFKYEEFTLPDDISIEELFLSKVTLMAMLASEEFKLLTEIMDIDFNDLVEKFLRQLHHAFLFKQIKAYSIDIN